MACPAADETRRGTFGDGINGLTPPASRAPLPYREGRGKWRSSKQRTAIPDRIVGATCGERRSPAGLPGHLWGTAISDKIVGATAPIYSGRDNPVAEGRRQPSPAGLPGPRVGNGDPRQDCRGHCTNLQWPRQSCRGSPEPAFLPGRIARATCGERRSPTGLSGPVHQSTVAATILSRKAVGSPPRQDCQGHLWGTAIPDRIVGATGGTSAHTLTHDDWDGEP